MHQLDDIEVALGRLMPAALSGNGRASIEEMLDELAGEAPVETPPSRRWWLIPAGIAAAAAAMVSLVPDTKGDKGLVTQAVPAGAHSAGVVLVGESDRIEQMTDEGWLDDADGSAMHAVRISVVEEDSLMDEETGIVFQISEPREEVLLMPVSTF